MITRKQVRVMEAGRKLDGVIAERVLGAEKTVAYDTSEGDFFSYWGQDSEGGGIISHLKHYSTDPSADYEVLVFVRENWDEDKRLSFGLQLSVIFDGRWAEDDFGDIETAGYYYRPGDYSRAALLTTMS